MFGRKRKKRNNLLEMPLYERTQLTKEVKEKLRERAIESRLRQLLLDAETITVDGTVVYDGYCLVEFHEKLDTPLHI